MLRCFKLNPQLDWQGVMEEACSTWRTKNPLAVLCKLILNSVVYNLWQARNELRFQGQPKSEEHILKRIFWENRSWISGKGRFIKSKENINLCQMWNITGSVPV
jgi:hypothetical protein